jgi:hypothetical protein
MDTFFTSIYPLYSVLRVLVIFIDMLLFFAGIFAAMELFSTRPRFVYDPRKSRKGHAVKKESALHKVTAAWVKIHEKLSQGTPEAMRIAIIEADGLTDSVLKKRGYPGETFADRLSRFNAQGMESLDALWDAHRLRNDIVHTPGFHITSSQAEKAIHSYERFLKEIEAL